MQNGLSLTIVHAQRLGHKSPKYPNTPEVQGRFFHGRARQHPVLDASSNKTRHTALKNVGHFLSYRLYIQYAIHSVVYKER